MKNNRPGGGGGENIHIRISAQFLCRLLCDLEQILCWNLITAALRVTISSFLRKNIYLLKKFFLKTESFYAWVRGTISWPLFILKILLLLSTSPTSTTMHIYIREGRGSTESLAQEERRIKYIRNLCVLGVENSQLLWLHLTLSLVPFTEFHFPIF